MPLLGDRPAYDLILGVLVVSGPPSYARVVRVLVTSGCPVASSATVVVELIASLAVFASI